MSLFLSFIVLEVFTCFYGVLRLFKGCLKFKGSFNDVLKVFFPCLSLVLKSFNGVLRLFKGCLKFKGSFKDVSRKF